MYVIVWKLKMHHFTQQMELVLNEVIEYKTKNLDYKIEQSLKDNLKAFVVEARVVNKDVTFKWVNTQEKIDEL